MAKIARSLFWAEPAAFSALVERALRPTKSATVAPPVGAGRSPGGDKAPQLFARAASAVDRQRPFVAPQGSIEERFEALLRWLRKTTGCRQAFITDPEGLALVQYQAADELVAASASTTMTLHNLYQDLSLPRPRFLILGLSNDELLHQIMADTPWGLLTLGFTTVESISVQSLQTIRQALKDSLAEKEQPSHET